jgi:hypothetical protein
MRGRFAATLALLICACRTPPEPLRFDAMVMYEEPDAVADGMHWRLKTERGPVHVWRPAAYDPKTAGLVVYLHGYYLDVDAAWRDHRLAEQFQRSGRNALFVVPEVPTSPNEAVIWKDPAPLLEALRGRLDVPVPKGPIVVAGHSGAYRTIVEWLPSARVKQIVLLDGLYANRSDFFDWLVAKSDGPRPKLVLVPRETLAETNRLLEDFKDAERRPLQPDEPMLRTGARVLVLAAQDGHMELVTEGRALPLALRLTALPAL